MCGSDAPIRTCEQTEDWLVQYAGFSEDDWKAINRGNAERLFPRLGEGMTASSIMLVCAHEDLITVRPQQNLPRAPQLEPILCNKTPLDLQYAPNPSTSITPARFLS